jgi:hypothetical protein
MGEGWLDLIEQLWRSLGRRAKHALGLRSVS